jgi:hypothetical protein
MLSITVLQLLIFFIGIADFLPCSISPHHETRTFRWTTDPDLHGTSCAEAFASDNVTANDSWSEDYIGKDGALLVFLKRKTCCNT